MKVQLHHLTEKFSVTFKVKSIFKYNKDFVVFKDVDLSQDILEQLSLQEFGYTSHIKGHFQPNKNCQFDIVD